MQVAGDRARTAGHPRARAARPSAPRRRRCGGRGDSGGTRRRRPADAPRHRASRPSPGTPRSAGSAGIRRPGAARLRQDRPRSAARRHVASPSMSGDAAVGARARRQGHRRAGAPAAAAPAGPAIRSGRCRRRTPPRCRVRTPPGHRRAGRGRSARPPHGVAGSRRRIVGLHQGEGRARHLLVRPAAGADEGAGEDGLAGTEIAAQRDHVAGAGEPGQRPPQAPRSPPDRPGRCGSGQPARWRVLEPPPARPRTLDRIGRGGPLLCFRADQRRPRQSRVIFR